jgi:hypothetical protein
VLEDITSADGSHYHYHGAEAGERQTYYEIVMPKGKGEK